MVSDVVAADLMRGPGFGQAADDPTCYGIEAPATNGPSIRAFDKLRGYSGRTGRFHGIGFRSEGSTYAAGLGGLPGLAAVSGTRRIAAPGVRANMRSPPCGAIT